MGAAGVDDDDVGVGDAHGAFAFDEVAEDTGRITLFEAGQFLGQQVVERDGNMWKVKIRVVNHSNKDAVSLSASFVYLDAGGNAPDDFPHTIAGPYTAEGAQPAVAKQAEDELETTAFFMPDGTQGIRIDVNQVDFICLSV